MVTTIKKVKITLGIVCLAVVALFLFYNLPRTEVVQVSGTDIKRVDRESGKVVDKNATSESSSRRTYDVRYINTATRTGKTIVFRNEDTGWGWPPYFKFNSADLTAQAQAYASVPEKPWVLVRYYGWRIRIFSMFPNVVSLRTVDRDYSHFPLFNIVFLVVLAIGGGVVVWKVKKFLGRRRKSRGDGAKAEA